MALKQLAIAVLLVLTSFVAYATAQETEEEDFEFAAVIGRTFISNQGIRGDGSVRFGNGLTFEVNYAARVLSKRIWSVYLELPAAFNLDEDLNSDGPSPEQFRSYYVTPAARLHLNGALSPWVSLGGGYGRISESSRLLFGSPNPGKTGTNTGVVQFGAGLDVKTFKSIGFRVETRDFWSGVPNLNVNIGKSRLHNIFVAGGVVFHF